MDIGGNDNGNRNPSIKCTSDFCCKDATSYRTIINMKNPRDLKPEHVTALIDTREQLPWTLEPLKRERATLATGDYSVKGLESFVSIERKSLSDYLGCIGQGRERFEAEMQRILAYETRAVIVEATWQQLENGDWRRSKVTPQAVVGSTLGWIAKGVPIILAGDRFTADKFATKILFIAARRRYRETLNFLDNVVGG